MPMRAALVLPGSIRALTGGSIYDRRIGEGLRDRGWSVEIVALDSSFPVPTAAALESAAAALARLPSRTVTIVDGLALGGMADLVAREAGRLVFVALVHLPLGLEVGTDPDLARQLEMGERRALQYVRAVVITGSSTVDAVAGRGVDRKNIHVVEPGTDCAAIARGSTAGPLHLLCVATLSEGKGHDVLLRALAVHRHESWRLVCVGNQDRWPSTTARLRLLIAELGFEDRVALAGESCGDALERAFDASDLFVLATRRETYGMAVAEALAHGLPVVSTTTGAIPELVGIDAGLLVPPGDVDALSAALGRVLRDAALRGRLKEGACAARARLRTWDDAVDRMTALISGIDKRG